MHFLILNVIARISSFHISLIKSRVISANSNELFWKLSCVGIEKQTVQ